MSTHQGFCQRCIISSFIDVHHDEPQGSFHHITEIEEHEKHANESHAGQRTN